jgi:hypothetical protein
MISVARRTAGLLLCACLTLVPLPGLLASDQFNGAWATYYTSGALNAGENNSAWLYGFYSDARYYDRLQGIQQYVLQPSIGYRYNSRLSFWTGYTYFRSEVTDLTTINENRIYEQVSWNMGRWDNTTLSSRTRLEQRSREHLHGTDLRLRQQFKLQYRLTSYDEIKLILGDEMFYNLRDTDWTRQGYSQNRLYAGVGLDFHDLSFEVLYMNQQYPLKNRSDIVNHLLVLNFKM